MTIHKVIATAPVRPTTAGYVRFSREEARLFSLNALEDRYNVAHNPSVRAQLESAFDCMLEASTKYLEACRTFEADTGLPLSHKATPRYFYEELEQIEKKDLSVQQRESLNKVMFADLNKCEATLFCISTARAILTESTGEKPALLDCHKMAGSIIRQVLDHVALHYGAEINTCKNPDVRVKHLRTTLKTTLQPL